VSLQVVEHVGHATAGAEIHQDPHNVVSTPVAPKVLHGVGVAALLQNCNFFFDHGVLVCDATTADVLELDFLDCELKAGGFQPGSIDPPKSTIYGAPGCFMVAVSTLLFLCVFFFSRGPCLYFSFVSFHPFLYYFVFPFFPFLLFHYFTLLRIGDLN
jgi:hypothetical protein